MDDQSLMAAFLTGSEPSLCFLLCQTLANDCSWQDKATLFVMLNLDAFVCFVLYVSFYVLRQSRYVPSTPNF